MDNLRVINSTVIEKQKQTYDFNLECQLVLNEFERQQVVNAAVDENLKTPHDYQCSICLQLLYHPLECASCEVATFCTPCIQKYSDIIDVSQCPTCKSNSGFRNIHRKVAAFLNSKMVQCIKQNCSKRNIMTQYEDFVRDHPDECIQKQAICPNGCGEWIIKDNRQSHFHEC